VFSPTALQLIDHFDVFGPGFFRVSMASLPPTGDFSPPHTPNWSIVPVLFPRKLSQDHTTQYRDSRGLGREIDSGKSRTHTLIQIENIRVRRYPCQRSRAPLFQAPVRAPASVSHLAPSHCKFCGGGRSSCSPISNISFLFCLQRTV